MGFTGTDIPWSDPMPFAASIAATEEDIVFLHSSLKTGYSGRYSILAWKQEASIQGSDFTCLPPFSDKPFFGYFSYELGSTLESLPSTTPSYISLPKLNLVSFQNILRFDHEKEIIESWGSPPRLPKYVAPHVLEAPEIASLTSNMSKDAYLSHTQDALDAIGAGNFYQVNLTRKFHGNFISPISTFDLYQRLITASPAPYSAYMRLGGVSILSSSPELFLRIKDGSVLSRPIKGTAPRGGNYDTDERNRISLLESSKDQAENLMIVDLMRHDLARVCEPGSINVDELFSIDSFPTLHHLSSAISGKLQPNKTSIDALKAAFPPGSMTGAPKIAAMRWLSKKEALNRGIYSGALGWFTAKEAEWSVVIRTLLIKGQAFEFQVGGGIVADSTPESEWQETIYKAEGILRSLGLNADAIKAI